MSARHDSPFLILRKVEEAALKTQDIQPRAVIGKNFGQMWQANDGRGDGPSFMLQWFGENHEYFDRQQVIKALTDITDWRARNPVKPH